LFDGTSINSTNLNIGVVSGYGITIQGNDADYGTTTLIMSSTTIEGSGTAGIITYGKNFD
jgi:hypothetical protein